MVKNLRMFLLTILCFLFSVTNTCRSDHGEEKEVHFSVSQNLYMLDYRLIKNGEIENRKYASFGFGRNYMNFTDYPKFFVSKNIEVLNFIDKLFRDVPWGSSMSQINNTQLINSSPISNRRVLIREEVLDPIIHFINTEKFEIC